MLVIVGFVCLSNEQFVVFKISKALLVTLGLPCIYLGFQQIVASRRALVLLWFLSWFLYLWFTLARLLCMSMRLHWLQMSPAAQVGSKPHRIRQWKANKPSPGVSLLEVEPRVVGSFDQRCFHAATAPLHARCLSALSSLYYPCIYSDQMSTHQHGWAWQAVRVRVLEEGTGLDVLMLQICVDQLTNHSMGPFRKLKCICVWHLANAFI